MADQTETSTDWSVFQDRLKEIWDDLKEGDLDGAQNSFEELVDRVQTVTGEKREQVQQKLEDLAERFNITFDS